MSTRTQLIRQILAILRRALKIEASIEVRPDGRFRVLVAGR